jgi:hypothetical protein
MPIAETTLNELFSGPREVAWRRIEGVRTFADKQPKSVSAAFEEAGLNFEVGMEPMYVRLDGEMIPVPDRNAIVRRGVSPRVWGVTGNKYKPLQNAEIAHLLNPLLEEWELDALAARNGGAEIMTVFKTNALEVNGEPLQEYVWFKETRNGKTALEVSISQVRLFCTNQFISGMRGSSFNASVKHGAGVESDVSFQVSVIKLLNQARKKLLRSYEAMGQRILTNEEIVECITRIYPDANIPGRVRTLTALAGAAEDAGGTLDDMIRDTFTQEQIEGVADSQYDYEREQSKIPILRQDLSTLIEKFNDEHSRLANTSWAVFNAATELADWGGSERGDSAARSALFGKRADVKIRAFNISMNTVSPDWDKIVAVAAPIAPRTRRQLRTAPTRTVEEEAALYRESMLRKYQVQVDRERESIETGMKEQPVDEHGNPVPLRTAQQRWDEDEALKRERTIKIAENLARAKQAAEEANLSIEERIALRRQRNAEAAAARREAILAKAAHTGEALATNLADDEDDE